MVKKILFTLFFITVVAGGLTLSSTIHFADAQTGTSISGIINSNTTWTKANSPYMLTGQVAVNTGVVLTIEPGATVNFAPQSTLEVKGILNSTGTIAENIQINNGSITFEDSTASGENQSSTSSIIENTILAQCSLSINNSLKINNDTITVTGGIEVDGGSPLISNCSITASGKGPQFIINTKTGSTALIANNTITPFLWDANNPFEIDRAGSTHYGIGAVDAIVAGNVISGHFSYSNIVANRSVIEANLLMSGVYGITILNGGSGSVIENNTIISNDIGIYGASSSAAAVFYNNIYNNRINFDGGDYDVSNATHNWWGTTDAGTINSTINGRVNFVPFLTAPNPQAPRQPEFVPSLSPTQTPPGSQNPMSPNVQTPTALPSMTPSTSSPQSPMASQEPTSTLTVSQVEPTGEEIVIVVGILIIIALLLVILWLLTKKRHYLKENG